MIGHRSFVVEAKGEAAHPRQPVNYFLGGLGELVERMAEPATTYALAQPDDNKQLRCLIARLPRSPRSG
jgi:hypothetical protein